jgi:hypothetical protein
MEGNKYFETRYTLFYSRRIGQSPQNWPDDDDYYIKEPNNTTILGAGKITGRTNNGWVIGILNSVTNKEDATYVDENGIRKTATVEEPANYNIMRVKKEFNDGSSLGLMSTAVHQNGYAPIYSGGVDWDLKMDDRKYSWGGQAVGSRYDDDGWAMDTDISKNAGKHVRWAMGSEYRSRDFDINRIGYIGRNDLFSGWAWWQYRDEDKPLFFREMYNNLNYWFSYNLDGKLINEGANYNNSITLNNNWCFGGGYEIEPSHYDDLETRGGPLHWVPTTTAGWIWVETPSSKSVFFGFNITYGTNRDGWHNRFSIFSSYKPSDNLELSIEPGYSKTWNQSRWITDDEDANGERVDIFGELDTENLDIGLRGTYMFNRNMSLEIYSQLFFASGKYSDIKELASPGKFKPLSIVYDGYPDFITKSLNLNMVYRWEYMPGSILYVVYTQARYDDNDLYNTLSFRRDTEDLFKLPADNVFLIKLSYWWNP